jgi:MFS-type transporter involved in bile tolerance (Atg22 family)
MSTDSRRVIWSWALYDFANSPFTTLVVTFVYATYFTQAIAADPIHGTALWSRAVTATALLVALLSPFLGALADRGGYRRVFIAGFTWLWIAATVALYFVRPGVSAFPRCSRCSPSAWRCSSRWTSARGCRRQRGVDRMVASSSDV